MPRDVSSSSEDESVNPTTESQPTQLGETAGYQCPNDFVSVNYKPCRSTFRKKLKKNSNELWLIKAPASFNPECFQGIQVPLSGLQTLKVHAPKGGEQRSYNVRASAHGTSELYLLTSDKNSSESLVFAPTFSGLLTVCETYGDTSGNQNLQVIPAAPAPSIPPGLAHRFPLLNRTGSTQTCAGKNEPEEPAKHFIEGTREEEQLRKKKKRKKEKKIKLEQEEETDALRVNENVSEIQDEVKTAPPFQEGSVLEEKKRKKKKKKRDREQEETEQVAEEVMVKCEPEDSWNNDALESSSKKKKKKRKLNGD